MRFYKVRGSSFSTFKPDDVVEIIELLTFLSQNETKLVLSGFPSQDLAIVRELKSDGNFIPPKDPSSVSKSDYLSKGFLIATIKGGSKPHAPYVFAQDERQTDYFIHIDAFENGNWANRHRLIPGVEVALKFEDRGSAGALPANEVWLIEP